MQMKYLQFNNTLLASHSQLLMFVTITLMSLSCSAQTNIIELWPDKVPNQSEEKQDPVISDNNTRNVTRIAKVTNPILTVFQPHKSNSNGKAVIICPGGGYQILAHDLEGIEVAEWFSNNGYTAFVLQYRVPENQAGALQDLQRAIRIVRHQSATWQIDKENIGVMGFSAGGSLSARASTQYNNQNYNSIDEADQESCRPDYTMLIYPAYLDKGEDRSLTPELKVDSETPPMFIFATADDRYSNSTLVMATALRDVNIPVTLHLMAEGGHGYGLRSGHLAAETWPILLSNWLATIDNKQ